MPAYMSCPNSLLPREQSDRPDLSREAIVSQEPLTRIDVLDHVHGSYAGTSLYNDPS